MFQRFKLTAAFLLLTLSTFAQIVISNSGSSGVLDRNPNRQVTSIMVIPIYPDTASASLKLDSLGMLFQVRTTGAIWHRDTVTGGGHRWTQILSGGTSGSKNADSIKGSPVDTAGQYATLKYLYYDSTSKKYKLRSISMTDVLNALGYVPLSTLDSVALTGFKSVGAANKTRDSLAALIALRQLILSNSGTGYRFLLNNNIKSIVCSGCTLDSTTNAGSLTITVSGGGSGNTNSNIGSGYRLAVPSTNNIKTIFCSGCTIDSTTNTNAITITVSGAGSQTLDQTLKLGNTTATPLLSTAKVQSDTGSIRTAKIGNLFSGDTSHAKLNFFVIGNSIEAGTAAVPSNVNGYAWRIAYDFGWLINNIAISGTRIRKISNADSSVQERIYLIPQYVNGYFLIGSGINDPTTDSVLFKVALGAVFDSCTMNRAAPAGHILNISPPFSPSRQDDSIFVSAQRTVCAAKGVIFIDLWHAMRAAYYAGNTGIVSGDSLHPSTPGGLMMAQLVMAGIPYTEPMAGNATINGLLYVKGNDTTQGSLTVGDVTILKKGISIPNVNTNLRIVGPFITNSGDRFGEAWIPNALNTAALDSFSATMDIKGAANEWVLERLGTGAAKELYINTADQMVFGGLGSNAQSGYKYTMWGGGLYANGNSLINGALSIAGANVTGSQNQTWYLNGNNRVSQGVDASGNWIFAGGPNSIQWGFNSGTGGVSYTKAMTLATNGALGLNVVPSSFLFDVNGTSRFSGDATFSGAAKIAGGSTTNNTQWVNWTNSAAHVNAIGTNSSGVFWMMNSINDTWLGHTYDGSNVVPSLVVFQGGGIGIGTNATTFNSNYYIQATGAMQLGGGRTSFGSPGAVQGVHFDIKGTSFKDTTSSTGGHTPYVSMVHIGRDTMTATATSITDTTLATLSIDGEPFDGTNVSSATLLSFDIKHGKSRFADKLYYSHDTTMTDQTGADSLTIPNIKKVGAMITAANGSFAPLASPGFTGTPTAPIPATSDSSGTLAPTAVVKRMIAAAIIPPVTILTNVLVAKSTTLISTSSVATTNILTYTTGAADSNYRIGATVALTANSGNTWNMQVTFTDENGTSQTVQMFVGGATVTNITAASGYYAFPPVDIRAKASTTITVTFNESVSVALITANTSASIIKLF